MGVYVRAKFEVSSVILTSFRQRGIPPAPPPPPHQGEPLKSPPILRLKGKGLRHYGSLLSANDYEKNDKITLKYFQ